jgi:dnd system-associated protein 4
MFAAALGAHIEKREAVKATEEGIRWQIFETQGDNAFIYALAVAETGGLEVLNDADAGDAYVTIFEEYANAGLIYIDEQILSKPIDPLEAIISLLLDIRSREDKVVAGLEGITAEQLNALGL